MPFTNEDWYHPDRQPLHLTFYWHIQLFRCTYLLVISQTYQWVFVRLCCFTLYCKNSWLISCHEFEGAVRFIESQLCVCIYSDSHVYCVLHQIWKGHVLTYIDFQPLAMDGRSVPDTFAAMHNTCSYTCILSSLLLNIVLIVFLCSKDGRTDVKVICQIW